MKNPLVKIFKAENGEWHWHTTAENGKILSKSSEGYSSRPACVEGFVDSTRAHLRSCLMGQAARTAYIDNLRDRFVATSGPEMAIQIEGRGLVLSLKDVF